MNGGVDIRQACRCRLLDHQLAGRHVRRRLGRIEGQLQGQPFQGARGTRRSVTDEVGHQDLRRRRRRIAGDEVIERVDRLAVLMNCEVHMRARTVPG